MWGGGGNFDGCNAPCNILKGRYSNACGSVIDAVTRQRLRGSGSSLLVVGRNMAPFFVHIGALAPMLGSSSRKRCSNEHRLRGPQAAPTDPHIPGLIRLRAAMHLRISELLEFGQDPGQSDLSLGAQAKKVTHRCLEHRGSIRPKV